MAHCEDVMRLDPVGGRGSSSILCDHPYTLLQNPDVSYVDTDMQAQRQCLAT